MAATKNPDSAIRDHIQQSIRFAMVHLAWLKAETDRTGMSINAVVRQLVDDARSCFGLPPTMVETLEKDRARLGLDHRGYVQELLTQRYRDILRTEFQSSGPSQRQRK